MIMVRIQCRPLLMVVGLFVMSGFGRAIVAAEPRPKIALVLSGGGARGAAHAGVIKRLEELRIPIDLVVGTSMGSIMGGLYAAGYDAAGVERVLAESDWSSLFSDKPARDQLWYRRRQDDRVFQVDLELGWKNGGVALPPGFILGLNAEAFLEQLLLPVAPIKRFDDLPIPFRCVATEIKTGAAYAPAQGDLATAIRASMSLPGVFAPVTMDGKPLMDGGVVDNFPVRLAQSLGADIVIAVDLVGENASDLSGLSAMGVFNQMLTILMQENRRLSLAALRPSDVLIQPHIGTIGLMEFDQYAKGIAIGLESTTPVLERLKSLSVSPEAYQAWREQVAAKRPATPRVRSVKIEGRTGLSDAVLKNQVAIMEGAPLSGDALRQTRDQLAGLVIIEHVDIELVPVADAAAKAEQEAPREVDVIVRPQEKSWGPNYFRFGLGVSSDLQGEGEFDVGIQHTWTPLNGYGGEWRNEVQIGTRGRVFSEFYQPLDTDLRWFVAPFGEYEYDSVPIIINREAVAEYDLDAISLGLAFGRNLGYWGEFRMAYGWVTGTAEPRIVPPGFSRDTLSFEEHILRTTLTVDTLDSAFLPREGFYGQLRWTERQQEFTIGDDKSVLFGKFALPMTIGGFSLIASAEGGHTLTGDPSLGNEFYLGGFRRLSGLSPLELSGEHLLLGVLQAHYVLGERTTALSIAPFVGLTLEAGNVWQDEDDIALDDLNHAVSVFVGALTIVGQCYFGGGYTDGDNYAVYLFIGPTF
jgi:NTE family protein